METRCFHGTVSFKLVRVENHHYTSASYELIQCILIWVLQFVFFVVDGHSVSRHSNGHQLHSESFYLGQAVVGRCMHQHECHISWFRFNRRRSNAAAYAWSLYRCRSRPPWRCWRFGSASRSRSCSSATSSASASSRTSTRCAPTRSRARCRRSPGTWTPRSGMPFFFDLHNYWCTFCTLTIHSM